MADELIQILDEAIILEKMAMRYYQSVSERSPDASRKPFWRSMAVQEGEHLGYWKQLRDLAAEGRIRNVFDAPAQILHELKSIRRKVAKATRTIRYDQPEQLFLTAYRLEFYMLHPAFEALFHLMRHQTGDRSPEDSYVAHLQNLFTHLGDLDRENPAFGLIEELVEQIFRSNQEMARQLAQVKELRGLLPICMHCKNIRNDEGYWQKIEYYISDHAGVEFSHGICQDCMRKYYPEIAEDLEQEDG